MASTTDDMPPEEPAKFSDKMYPKGVNFDFMDPDKNPTEIIAKFAGDGSTNGLFESEERDIARHSQEIVTAVTPHMNLAEDSVIADVGAGTGLLLQHLCAAVPAGQVLACELAPCFREFMANRIAEQGLTNVTIVEASAQNPFSGEVPPKGSVDAAFICDVYHHLEYPLTTCRHVARALKPNGRLIVIDFHRDPEKVTSRPPEWAFEHLRADQDTFRAEIESAGFRLIDDVAIPELSENYCMVFEPHQPDMNAPGSGWTS